MDRGSYVAASGGLLQFRKLDVVNNNLANVNTPGFKKQMVVGDVQTFDQTLASLTARQDAFAKGDHDRTPGTVNLRTVTDFSPGPIKPTGNQFDVALEGANDFFVVNTPEGQQYTRAGNFTLAGTGEIVTMEGQSVLGDGGPIVANGPGATISPNGTVTVNNQIVGKLQVAHFEDTTKLERTGAARFKLGAGQAAPEQVEPRVIPQALEMSNVSAISSIVNLITTNRGFEMYTKTSQTLDGMNQTAITQIGKRG